MDHVISQRKFLLRDKNGRNVDVVATLRSIRGQTADFSVTCQHGAAHDEILAAAPDEVRADLKALIALHMSDHNGVPMHAVANAAYHIKNTDFRLAQETLRGSKLEDMYRLHDEAQGSAADFSALMNRLKTAAAKVVSTHEAMVRETKERNSIFNRYEDQFLDATDAYTALRDQREPLSREAKARRPKTERMKDAGKLVEKGLLTEAGALVGGHPGEKLIQSIKARFVDKRLKDLVAEFARVHCMPRWTEEAARCREILTRPDYIAPGRPAPELDPTTWVGFANSLGLTINTRAQGWVRDGDFKGSNKYGVALQRDGRSFEFPFFLGSAHRSGPTLAMVFETMQSDIGSTWGRDRDEWISELGYDESLKSVRRGEEIFEAIAENRTQLRELLGEEGFRQLMTSVGDNPPLSEDFFASEAPSPGI